MRSAKISKFAALVGHRLSPVPNIKIQRSDDLFGFMGLSSAVDQFVRGFCDIDGTDRRVVQNCNDSFSDRLTEQDSQEGSGIENVLRLTVHAVLPFAGRE